VSLHLIPADELARHTTDGCACTPSTKPYELGNGPVRPAIVHHSLAGRDAEEG
jgi:hypothetical protein